MTTYKLRFHVLALREWQQLDASVREPFKKKLAERLLTPRVTSAALHGMPDCYKIKLRDLGYRLVYRVDSDKVVLVVLAVGKRQRSEVYETAGKRLNARLTEY